MERAARSIVVIGASAGGVQALFDVLGALPSSFPSAVLVVVHIGEGRSVLPELLSRKTNLTASHAVHGERLRPGHILVAPSDYHLLVRGDSVELSRGPHENRSRPAIDPLFRSAARFHGPGTTGVILSGALSDGSTGLQMIKSRGGVTIVQDPEDAMVSGMPTSALRLVNPDHVLPAREIGALLNQTGTPAERREVANLAETLEEPAEIIHQAFAAQERDQRDKQLTMYTCPDCGGTLWQTDTGPVLHVQCHVGHAWGAEALLDHKSELLEAALWTSVRMLEERATLSRQLAARIRRSSTDRRRLSAAEDEADLDEQRADAIRRLLAAPAPVMQGGATNGDHGGNSH